MSTADGLTFVLLSPMLRRRPPAFRGVAERGNGSPGTGGRAVLKLDDGSRIEVFEETRIEANELMEEEEKGFSLSLFAGHLSLKLKKLLKKKVCLRK